MIFLYVGGIPRNGTMSCGAFLHLHPRCFIYMVMNGTHPPNRVFYSQLRDRHVSGGVWNGMQYLPPALDKGKPDPFGFSVELRRRNAEADGKEVFTLPVVGVREDFATGYFLRAKSLESSDCIGGRRVKLIFLVRRNIERLYYAQHDMKLQNQRTIKDKAAEFLRKLSSAYMEAEKAIKEHGKDVLVANVVDPPSYEEEYMRICSFLGIEPTPLMRTWIQEHPVTNTFGETVRNVVNEIKKTDFHKKYVE